MARPRKQTYTLEMYLSKIEDGDIDNNADVQRHFVWSKEQINELIVTVLDDEYIPPIILGEESNSQLHITDGGCRSAALNSFRNGNYKVTSATEDSIISYKKKVKKEDGSIEWEDATFDIRNKTYEKLPDELKKRFNEYQIETIIHENCDSHRISKYIKRYNNHTPMNTDQKAFTYIDKFAGNIREILDSRFFLDHSSYSESERVKGVVERVVIETIMCTNHLDKWRKQPKILCKYLNNNASKEEFERLADHLHRLENVITDDIKSLFNKKDSFLFLTLFDRFVKLGIDDVRFAAFLREFKDHLRLTRRNGKGMLFDEIDKDLSTKDKAVIVEKLDMLNELMLEFLHMDHSENAGGSLKKEELEEITFISENVGIDKCALEKDIGFYHETLDDLEEKTIKLGSKLLEKQNRLSLLAMVAYSYKEDQDLDDWLKVYAEKNPMYFADQKKNFLHMREEFERFHRVSFF